MLPLHQTLKLVPIPGTAPGHVRLTGGSVRLLGRWEYGAATENRTPIIGVETQGSSQTTTAAKLVPKNGIEPLAPTPST